MDKATLKKAYRNAWILLFIVSAFVVVFFYLTLETNKAPPKPTWDMGGSPFVPASGNTANGYYSPVEKAEQPASKEAK